MLQSKNNLQKLSPTGFITESSFNFTISCVIINHESVYVRRSNRNKIQKPKYVFKQKYTKKSKLPFYYCEKCNALQRFKICLACENKLYSPSDFDTSSTVSSESEIDQLDRLDSIRESEPKTINALKNVKLNKFKYISNQNGYIDSNIKPKDELYFSDNDLMMDSDVDLLVFTIQFNNRIDFYLRNKMSEKKELQELKKQEKEKLEDLLEELKKEVNCHSQFLQQVLKDEIVNILKNPEKKVIVGQYKQAIKIRNTTHYGGFTFEKFFSEDLFPVYYDELPDRLPGV
jgi:hypothetical protein